MAHCTNRGSLLERRISTIPSVQDGLLPEISVGGLVRNSELGRLAGGLVSVIVTIRTLVPITAPEAP